jgi:hypothetical protein
VGNREPVKDLLLLLRADAAVAEEEVKEGGSDVRCGLDLIEYSLRLLETGIDTRLEVAEVREDTLFPLLGVLDGTTECLKAEE